MGFKGEVLKVINFQQLGKQKNKTKSLKDELTTTGKTDTPNQIQQGETIQLNEESRLENDQDKKQGRNKQQDQEERERGIPFWERIRNT